LRSARATGSWVAPPGATIHRALAVPSVGDGIPPSVERWLLAADLVVLYRSGPNATAAAQLERLGIRTVLFDLNLLEELGPVARRLGLLTGHQRAGTRSRRCWTVLQSSPNP